MNTRPYINGLFHFLTPRVSTVMLIALPWSAPVFCSDIHDAAKSGDLAKVQALLKDCCTSTAAMNNCSESRGAL
jgi:hypothetical protein